MVRVTSGPRVFAGPLPGYCLGCRYRLCDASGRRWSCTDRSHTCPVLRWAHAHAVPPRLGGRRDGPGGNQGADGVAVGQRQAETVGTRR